MMDKCEWYVQYMGFEPEFSTSWPVQMTTQTGQLNCSKNTRQLHQNGWHDMPSSCKQSSMYYITDPKKTSRVCVRASSTDWLESSPDSTHNLYTTAATLVLTYLRSCYVHNRHALHISFPFSVKQPKRHWKGFWTNWCHRPCEDRSQWSTQQSVALYTTPITMWHSLKQGF